MITLRRMTGHDIPAGLALCRAAGWNQLERDWRLFLDLAPETTVVAEVDGAVAGSVALLDYRFGFAWLAMLLVDPAYRSRGIGAALFERALDMSSGIPCVRLDATPSGREIYRKYGFADEREITRFEGVAGNRGSVVLPPGDLSLVFRLDREAFGADRGEVLRRSLESGAALLEDGFAGARPGFLARHIGPVVAGGADAALSLIQSQADQDPGASSFIDVAAGRSFIVPRGFVARRSFMRMIRGKNPSPGRPERQFAILGPEFG